MQPKRTLNGWVLIKLDPENQFVKLRNGIELYVDTTYEPEKHATVTGQVWGLPSHLTFCGVPNMGMPWLTSMEVKMYDRVILYYLSVMNALNPKEQRYVIEGGDRYVLIAYQHLYCVIRDEKIIPLNGYCLIEPVGDPAIEAEKKRLADIKMELVVLRKRSKSEVSYGIVRYLGVPNRRYTDVGQTDDGVDIAVNDVVIMKRTVDVPLQYDLHQKIHEGKKLLRVQRRHILAKI